MAFLLASVNSTSAAGFKAFSLQEENSAKAGRLIHVELSDNGLDFRLSSTADTVGEFLIEQKLELLPQDSLFPPADASLSPNSKIIIQRSTDISIVVDGETLVLHSTALTIADLLDENEIVLGQLDYSVPGIDTEIEPHMSVEIMRVNFEDREELENIAFGTDYIDDPSMYTGTSETRSAGVFGQKKIIVRLRLENGEETSREVLSSETIKSPVNKVVARGTKAVPISGSWGPTILAASSQYGVDPYMVNKIMHCESGGRADAYNPAGPYIGLFQFLTSTFNSNRAHTPGYENASIWDGIAQIYVAVSKMSRDGYGAWPHCSQI